MTHRTELQHRIAECKMVAMNWLANRLFSFREKGIDGILKWHFLRGKKKKHFPNDPSNT